MLVRELVQNTNDAASDQLALTFSPGLPDAAVNSPALNQARANVAAAIACIDAFNQQISQ